MTVIGISGKSCSGKTSLAQSLGSKLNCKVLCLEEEYHIQGSVDWEVPESYDFNGLRNAILRHRDEGLVVEGFLLFVSAEITDLLDVKVFLDVSDKTSVSRRLGRGNVHRRDSSPEYLEKVVEGFRKYEGVQRAAANYLLDAEVSQTQLFERALLMLRREKKWVP